MFFRKKPKRLYIPTKSRWYRKPRRRPKIRKSSTLFKGGIQKALVRTLKNAFYFVVIAAALVALAIALFFSSYLSITDIEVNRENFNIDSAAIENLLNQFIGKNIMFFPRSRIVRTIQHEFPEFISVVVNKELPRTIRISLESYPIVANLRAYYVLPKIEEMPPLFDKLNEAIRELEGTTENTADYISPDDTASANISSPFDESHVVEPAFSLDAPPVESALVEEGNNEEPVEQKSLLNRIGQAIFDQEEDLELITVIIRGLTQPVEDRQIVIHRKKMDYILETMHYFTNAMDLDIYSIEYLPVAREIHLKTNQGPVIWIAMERDYKSQIDKLNTIYGPAELDKEDISYIDLRVREKVIYCPVNARCNQ